MSNKPNTNSKAFSIIDAMRAVVQQEKPKLEILHGSTPHEFYSPCLGFEKVFEKQINDEMEAARRNCEGDSKKLITAKGEIRTKYAAAYKFMLRRNVLWRRSERLLDVLRTKGVISDSPESMKLQNESLDYFARQLPSIYPEIDSQSSVYEGTDNPYISEDRPLLSPNVIFQETHANLISLYGQPFHELIEPAEPLYFNPKYDSLYIKSRRINGINPLFWAALLGGDKRLHHDVIFYQPERQFYFYDVAMRSYFPTSETKLRFTLSLALQQCAVGQDAATATMILEKFRTKAVFDDIIGKAKALLAAEKAFFVGSDARRRCSDTQQVPDVGAAVGSFVKEHVKQIEGAVMTVGECLQQLETTGTVSLSRKEATKRLNETIREVFDKGLRNDLLLSDGHCVAGWKGLSLHVRPASTNDLEGAEGVIRESGLSVASEPKSDYPPSGVALMG